MTTRAQPFVLIALLAAPGCASPGSEPPVSGGSTSTMAATSTGEGLAASTTASVTGDAESSGTTVAVDDGQATFNGPGPMFCPEGVEPTMQLGHGEELFVPADEAVATLVHGRQGGYHIVLGLRAQGLDLSDWGSGRVSATLAGQEISDHETTVVMNCDDSGQFSTALWVNLVFDDGIGPAVLLEQTITAHAEFIDASEQVVVADAEVTIGDTVVGG